PHDLELSGRDAETIAQARLVLYLGGDFQPALEDAVEATDATALDLLRGSEDDPHVWLDPTRYADLARRIGEALGDGKQSRKLVDELSALDAEFEEGLADCARREIVTSHAAFGHLAKRYDLEQVAITGISPEAEPTPGELRSVVAEVRESGATTIFFETLVSPRLAETVAREIGAETAVLNPLEGLTEEQAAAGEDYFSIMRANLAALREALGCR
nr:zinc ABC transporter substrate-binding protein [Actinomycetota bacterium]